MELNGDRATGESTPIAHHVSTIDGARKIMIASLRSGWTGRWSCPITRRVFMARQVTPSRNGFARVARMMMRASDLSRGVRKVLCRGEEHNRRRWRETPAGRCHP
jgi:hypothetical protein